RSIRFWGSMSSALVFAMSRLTCALNCRSFSSTSTLKLRSFSRFRSRLAFVAKPRVSGITRTETLPISVMKSAPLLCRLCGKDLMESCDGDALGVLSALLGLDPRADLPLKLGGLLLPLGGNDHRRLRPVGDVRKEAGRNVPAEHVFCVVSDGLAGGARREPPDVLQNQRRRGAVPCDHGKQVHLVVVLESAEKPPAILVDQSCEGEASPSSTPFE